MNQDVGGVVVAAAVGGITPVETANMYVCKHGESKGARLTLRRAKPSMQAKLMAAICYRDEITASKVQLLQIAVMWGVTDASGLMDERKAVAFDAVFSPALMGERIASEAVYDAISDRDAGEIFRFVFGKASLSEINKGN